MFIQFRPKPLQEYLMKLFSQEEPPVLKEFELIQMLKAEQLLPQLRLSDPLQMFRCHFFIFHQLYWLDHTFREKGLPGLEIHSLSIRRITFHETITVKDHALKSIALNDGLRHYYLSWEPFFLTRLEDIYRLLDFAFKNITQPQAVEQALSLFNLTMPTTLSAIDRQYRQLVKLHHPDKGGTPAQMSTINTARHLLKQFV